jgi:hypothetical protein
VCDISEIPMGECGRGWVAYCRDRANLAHVAAELLCLERWLNCRRGWWQELCGDTKWLAVDKIGHRCLQVPLVGCAYDGTSGSLGPLLVRMAHDDGFRCAVKTFHEAIRGGMVGVVRQRWMPPILVRQWKSWDSNWCPWPVVIVCGQQKRDIQPESRACDTVSAVM